MENSYKVWIGNIKSIIPIFLCYNLNIISLVVWIVTARDELRLNGCFFEKYN